MTTLCQTAKDDTPLWSLKVLQVILLVTQRILAKEAGINVITINLLLKAVVEKFRIR
jgi:hypothetical protein